jgi:hypothetical protein
MASRLLLAPVVLAALAFTSVAHADPSAADKETARGLMNEGRADRDKGDLQAAAKAFAGADALMHVPTTGIELARALAAIGQLVEARDAALRVTRIAEKAGEPAPFRAARDAAAELNADLGARIPSLTILLKNVPDGMTATVFIDGSSLPAELLGQPRKLDPGHHVITAKAGTAEGKQEVDVAEKDAKEVTVELPAQTAATTDTKPDETPPPPEAPASSGGNKLMIYGGFGLAGAGLIAGSITGILAISKASSIKSSSSCQNVGGTEDCNPSENGDLSSGKTEATISTVSFIVAGVGAAIGITGFFVGGSSAPAATPADAPAPPDQTSMRIIPWIGLGSAGVHGTF